MVKQTQTAWFVVVALLALIWQSLSMNVLAAGEPWNRWVIDDQFEGADGVRLADVNHDGLPDITTGWEESGLIRLYVHPGYDAVRKPWPVVILAKAKSPEDAVACDLDGDGRLDVVSCHEGRQREVLVHWNNMSFAHTQTALDPNSWSTSRFKQVDGDQWMFAVPMGLINGRVAMALGSKNQKASITLLLSPEDDHRDLRRWQVIRLRDAGWIMSLQAMDMNADGLVDLVFTDRKGPTRGAAWLQQPIAFDDVWTEHPIGGSGEEVMFLTASPQRCLVATRNGHYWDCQRADTGWRVDKHPNPRGLIMGKAIASMGQGRLVMTLNTLFEELQGKPVARPGIWVQDAARSWHPIDPTTRTKFDRIELLDMDHDGDLDVLTCEERRNLGVIWYENPG
ncbi:MAG: VCBS repeat-containing protein [Planctomycetota bacterium]